MAQDYVSRGQKRKKPAPKKTSKPSPKPWFKVSIAILLLCGFGFALYLLKSNPVQPENNGTSEIVETPQSQNTELSSDVDTAELPADKDPLPVLGEEEWAFIDALPEYSVEVDIPEVEESDRIYIMQCGSFRGTERAQELRAQLALQGLESQMLQSDGQNGRWYRVVLGPYERKRAAERDRHQARKANINNCKIY